jgi:hypothetical protein
VVEEHHVDRNRGGRPPYRPSTDAAGLFILGVLLSSSVAGVVVLPHVEKGIARDSKLTAAERRHAASDKFGLDARQFDAFRGRLQPRQRYSMEVPEGPRFPYFTLGKVVRDYGAYYFLPAIKVRGGRPVFRYRFR